MEILLKASSLTRLYLLATFLAIGGPVHAQAAATPTAVPDTKPLPEFDVSTIKPNNTGSGSIRISVNDGLLQATNVQMKGMLELAFDVRQDSIFGLPHSVEASHYDIVAKVVDADPKVLEKLTREQRGDMVRHLLKDRFKLKWHREIRTLPVLELVAMKSGSKLTPSTSQSDDTNMNTSNSTLTATHVSMDDLARFLANQTHNPVVDKTGLAGKYDLQLKWRREEQSAQSGATDDPLPTLYTAIQEQLGLKLESGKGPVNVLVIDHIEEPTEN
jgi:bla regulator protein BlaR1